MSNIAGLPFQRRDRNRSGVPLRLISYHSSKLLQLYFGSETSAYHKDDYSCTSDPKQAPVTRMITAVLRIRNKRYHKDDYSCTTETNEIRLTTMITPAPPNWIRYHLQGWSQLYLWAEYGTCYKHDYCAPFSRTTCLSRGLNPYFWDEQETSQGELQLYLSCIQYLSPVPVRRTVRVNSRESVAEWQCLGKQVLQFNEVFTITGSVYESLGSRLLKTWTQQMKILCNYKNLASRLVRKFRPLRSYTYYLYNNILRAVGLLITSVSWENKGRALK
jgi:hypothetical protein